MNCPACGNDTFKRRRNGNICSQCGTFLPLENIVYPKADITNANGNTKENKGDEAQQKLTTNKASKLQTDAVRTQKTAKKSIDSYEKAVKEKTIGLFRSAMALHNTHDYEKAYPFFLEAAKYGHTEAQYYVGEYLDFGQGVEPDHKTANQYYEKAVKNGNVMAMAQLGNNYLMGLGIDQDTEKGLKLIRKAADKNIPQAINNLGYAYEHGLGVSADMKQANAYYLKAAELGDVDGQYNLGISYLMGREVEVNKKTAASWFYKAAKQRHSGAENNLGVLFSMGDGVTQNFLIGYFWFKKADEDGHPRAKEIMEEIHETTRDNLKSDNCYNIINNPELVNGLGLTRETIMEQTDDHSYTDIGNSKQNQNGPTQFKQASKKASSKPSNSERASEKVSEVKTRSNKSSSSLSRRDMVNQTHKDYMKNWPRIEQHCRFVVENPYQFDVEHNNALSEGIDLKRNGKFVESNLFYINYIIGNKVITPTILRAWYKAIAGCGDLTDAISLLSYAIKNLPSGPVKDTFIEDRDHVISPILKSDDKSLIEYLTAISGNYSNSPSIDDLYYDNGNPFSNAIMRHLSEIQQHMLPAKSNSKNIGSDIRATFTPIMLKQGVSFSLQGQSEVFRSQKDAVTFSILGELRMNIISFNPIVRTYMLCFTSENNRVLTPHLVTADHIATGEELSLLIMILKELGVPINVR